MEKLIMVMAFVGSVLALLFALGTAFKVLRFPEGTDRMKKISASIRKGANAYLGRQYRIVSVFFAVMFVILGVMAWAVQTGPGRACS